MEQLSFFNVSAFSAITTVVDSYWDEIVQETEPVLMVVNSDEGVTSTTISKRSNGSGTGRITKRTISKNGKMYYQYWYDWQFYKDGRTFGRSKYIPKRLLPQIQVLEEEKVPVAKILELLGVLTSPIPPNE